METLAEIAAAAAASLPLEQQKRLIDDLSQRLNALRSKAAPPHGVLDIPPVSLGKLLRGAQANDDLLGEMLEHRR